MRVKITYQQARIELLEGQTICAIQASQFEEYEVVTSKKKKKARKLYTTADIKLLKQHSKARTPVSKISKEMKRSIGSLRQKALQLGIGLGHQR